MRDEDRDAPVRRLFAFPRGPEATARGGRITLEQRVLGFRVERGGGLVQHQQQGMVAHEAPRQRQLLPLPKTHVHARRPARPELGRETRHEAFDHIGRAGAIHGGHHGRFVVQPRHVANTHTVARGEFEAKEILKRAGQPLPPVVDADAREIDAIYQDAPTRR